MRRSNDNRRGRQQWKETRVSLTSATALLLDGPGNEWLLLVRGERTQPARAVRRSVKGGRS
jgi:hypothetical protein